MLDNLSKLLNDNQGALTLLLSLLSGLAAFCVWLWKRMRCLDSLHSTLTVKSNRSFEGYNDHQDDPDLSLTYKLVGDRDIQPQLPYLEKIKAGGLIESNFYHNTPFNFSFPSLIVDILNTGESPVLVRSFLFDVKNSYSTEQPVPIFHPCGPFSVNLVNEGREPMKNVKISFYVSTKMDREIKEFDLAYTFDEVIEQQGINIAEMLKQQGVDVDYLVEKAGFDRLDAESHYRREENPLIRKQIKADYDSKIADALGPYKELKGELLNIHGKLIYEILNFDGQVKRVSLPFSTHTYIMLTPHAPPPLTAQYDVVFRVNDSKYQIHREDIHLLGAKDGYRFVFNLSALQSTSHQFDFKIITDVGKKTLTKSMRLSLFIPRSLPKNEDKLSNYPVRNVNHRGANN